MEGRIAAAADTAPSTATAQTVSAAVRVENAPDDAGSSSSACSASTEARGDCSGGGVVVADDAAVGGNAGLGGTSAREVIGRRAMTGEGTALDCT